MPTYLRQAMHDRLRQSPEMVAFLADFHAATGISLRLLDALGQDRAEPVSPFPCALCAQLHETAAGTRLCQRFTQQLLEEAGPGGITRRCDAGLHETAIPLRLGGQDLGYLVLGPTAAPEWTPHDLNRASHLLARAGIALDGDQILHLTAGAPAATPLRHDALRRLAVAWTERLLNTLSHHLVPPPTELPDAVDKACRFLRAHFMEDINAAQVAAAVGWSPGHLSRQFHQATGVRLVEYLARVRVEHARAALAGSERAITEIAYDCGFQSLSQFQRTFRRLTGSTPSAVREQARR